MIEEYETWEDSIRRTFIELGDYMNQHSNPIEFLIDFAWANGADRFVVNNGKDELKKLREKSKEMSIEAFRANQFAIEEMNMYLEKAKELDDLRTSLDHPVAYARISEDGLLYDLNIQNNPYNDQSKVIPLYRLNR